MLYRWNPNATSPQGRKTNKKAIGFLENKIREADERALQKVTDEQAAKIEGETKAKKDATERDNLLYQVYNAGHAWTDAQMVAKSKTLDSMQFGSTAGSSINGHIVGLGDAPLVLTDVGAGRERPQLRPLAGQAQLSIRKTAPRPIPSMPGFLGDNRDNQGFGGIIPVRLEQLDDDTLRATLDYFKQQTFEQEEANQERTDRARAASAAQSEENKRRAEELTYQRRHWGLDPEAWFDQRSGQIDLPGGRGRGLSFKKPFGPHKPLGTQKPLGSTIDHNQDMGRVNPMLGIDINQPIQAYDYGAPTITPQDIEFNPPPSLPPLVPSFSDQADNIMRGGTTGLPGSGTENRGPNVAPIIAGGNTYQRLPDDILLAQGLPRELVDIYQQVYSDKDGYPISLRPTENSWQKGVDRFIHQPLETASKDLWESGNGLTSFFPAALNFAAGLALDSPTYSPGYVGEFENGTKLVIPSDTDVPLAVDFGIGIIANRIASISRLRAQARALDTANERALALGKEAPFYPPAIRPDATTPPIRPEITPQTTAESAGIFPDLFSPAPGSRITIGTNEINDVVLGPGNLQTIDPNTGRLARGSVDVNGNPSGGRFPTQGQRSGGLPVYDPNTGSFSTQLRTPAQEFNPLPFESFPSNIDTVTAPRVIDSPGSTTTIDVFPSQATPRVAVTPPISGNVSIAPSPNSVRRSLTKRGLSPLVELDDDAARRIYQDFVEQGGVGSESAGKWLRSRIDSLNNAAIREGIGSGIKVVDLDPQPATSPGIMNNQPVTPSERTGFYSNTTPTTPTTPKPASVTVKPSVKPDISKPLMDYDSISTTVDKPTTPRRTELRPVETVVDADGRIIEVKPITEKDLSTSAGRSSLNSGESTITPKVNDPSLPAIANRQAAFEFLTEKMKLNSPFIGAEAGDWRLKPLAKTYDDFIKNIGGLDGLSADKTALLKRLENADPNLIEIADLSFRKWSGGTIEKGRQGSMSTGFWDWTRGTNPQNIASYVQQYQQGSRGLVAKTYGEPFLKELEFIKKFNQIAPQGLYKGGIVYAQDGGLTKNLFNEVRGVGSTNPDAIYRFDPSVSPNMQKYFLKDKGYPVELRTADGSLDRFKTSSISNFLLDSGATAPAIDAVYEDGTIVKNLGDPGDIPLAGDLLAGGGALAFRKLAKLKTAKLGNRLSSSPSPKIILTISRSRVVAKYADGSGEIVADSIQGAERLFSVQSARAVKGSGPKLYDAVMEAATEQGGKLVSDRYKVSDSAHNVWQYYFRNRPDVNRTPLDLIDWHHGDRLDKSKFTGPDPASWPAYTDDAWTLNMGYTKQPDLINNTEAVQRIEAVPKYKGGIIYANNGMLVPYQPKGTDTVPAMLTPGEFVVNRRATQENLPLLKSINNGTSYLQTGGPTGSSSTNAGTGISFDITKFIDSVGSFHSSIGDFSVYVENFNKYVTKLEKLNIPSIPDKIEMVGTHRVDVTVTGAAAFEAIEEGVKSMINTKIGEKWSELWQQSGGQFGGPTR